jgi:hypothetical protein
METQNEGSGKKRGREGDDEFDFGSGANLKKAKLIFMKLHELHLPIQLDILLHLNVVEISYLCSLSKGLKERLEALTDNRFWKAIILGDFRKFMCGKEGKEEFIIDTLNEEIKKRSDRLNENFDIRSVYTSFARLFLVTRSFDENTAAHEKETLFHDKYLQLSNNRFLFSDHLSETLFPYINSCLWMLKALDRHFPEIMNSSNFITKEQIKEKLLATEDANYKISLEKILNWIEPYYNFTKLYQTSNFGVILHINKSESNSIVSCKALLNAYSMLKTFHNADDVDNTAIFHTVRNLNSDLEYSAISKLDTNSLKLDPIWVKSNYLTLEKTNAGFGTLPQFSLNKKLIVLAWGKTQNVVRSNRDLDDELYSDSNIPLIFQFKEGKRDFNLDTTNFDALKDLILNITITSSDLHEHHMEYANEVIEEFGKQQQMKSNLLSILMSKNYSARQTGAAVINYEYKKSKPKMIIKDSSSEKEIETIRVSLIPHLNSKKLEKKLELYSMETGGVKFKKDNYLFLCSLNEINSKNTIESKSIGYSICRVSKIEKESSDDPTNKAPLIFSVERIYLDVSRLMTLKNCSGLLTGLVDYKERLRFMNLPDLREGFKRPKTEKDEMEDSSDSDSTKLNKKREARLSTTTPKKPEQKNMHNSDSESMEESSSEDERVPEQKESSESEDKSNSDKKISVNNTVLFDYSTIARLGSSLTKSKITIERVNFVGKELFVLYDEDKDDLHCKHTFETYEEIKSHFETPEAKKKLCPKCEDSMEV